MTSGGRLRILAEQSLARGRSHRFLAFGLVGASGLVVNTGVLALASTVFGLPIALGVIIATESSTTWNFLLSERLVFQAGERAMGPWARFAQFAAVNNAALLLRGPMIALLIGARLHYLVANLVSLVALVVIRYLVADRLIWRTAPAS